MERAGISDGDELIVNRALEPSDGCVVVAVLDGELTVKRLRITASGVVLQADNPALPGHPGSAACRTWSSGVSRPGACTMSEGWPCPAPSGMRSPSLT